MVEAPVLAAAAEEQRAGAVGRASEEAGDDATWHRTSSRKRRSFASDFESLNASLHAPN